MLNLKRNILTNILILLFFFTTPGMAQELPPPESENLETGFDPESGLETTIQEPVVPPATDPAAVEALADPTISPDEFLQDPNLPFTGTLEEAYEAEKELFGLDEAEPEEEEVVAEEDYLLTFKFISTAQFQNPGGPSPFMEIEYETSFEIPIFVKNRRSTKEAEAIYEIQNWGFLAQNEFFYCDLKIEIQQQLPVKIVARLNTIPGEEEIFSAALKILFNKDMNEDWFANCTDVTSGATLNTQGNPEKYNFQILAAIEPSLAALIFEEFDPDGENEIQLEAPIKVVNDEEISTEITLRGEGKIILGRI